MTKPQPPSSTDLVIDARTREQVDDDERYRSAELNRYFALLAARAAGKELVDDEPSIVRGTD